MAKERMGFQTQKPLRLLNRIISASSNEGDLVLDPFCGCGTATIASHQLKRRWIGIDITHLVISLIKSRLREINVYANKHYKIIGEPVDFASATKLAPLLRVTCILLHESCITIRAAMLTTNVWVK